MRIVLDTNVIISALLFDGAPERLVRRLLGGEHQLVTSSFIIAETARILTAKFGISPRTVKLLQQLLSSSEEVYFEPYLQVVSDEPDNRILETALTGNADYLVTGDKLLLGLKQFEAVKIVTISQCLQKLSSSTGTK